MNNISNQTILNDAIALQDRLLEISSYPAEVKGALINETLLFGNQALEDLQQRVQQAAQNTPMFIATDISDTLGICRTILHQLADEQEASQVLHSQFDNNVWEGIPNDDLTTTTTTTTTTTATTVSNAQILRRDREAQDEEFRVCQFKDLYTALQAALTAKPESDFEILLPLFENLKEYVLGKQVFINDEAKSTLTQMLEEIETQLNDICTGQEAIEAQLEKSIRVQNEQNSALLSLQQALNSGNQDSTDEAFAQLEHEQKAQVLEFLEAILKEAGKIAATRKLPITWLNQKFSQWQALPEYKREALQRIFPSITTNTATTSVEAKAVEMRNRLNPVMNMGCQTTSTNTTPTSSVNPLSISLEPEEIDVSKLAAIKDLKVILNHLQMSNGEMDDVATMLALMESKKYSCLFFKHPAEKLSAVHERLYDHIESILYSDSRKISFFGENYGMKAFAGIDNSITKCSDRIRAVQRTIVEVALAGLEEAILSDDLEKCNQFLEILEEIKLNTNDRVKNVENAAFNLFGTFYHLHVAARENNSFLINPNDRQFRSDFGRIAFSMNKEGIDNSLKLEAIRTVKKAFRDLWYM